MRADRNEPDRRILKLVIMFSLLHFLVMASVSGVIFLAAHVPPKAVNLDAPIRVLQWFYEALRTPRQVLRWLWLSEQSPFWLNWLLTALNSLIWAIIYLTQHVLCCHSLPGG